MTQFDKEARGRCRGAEEEGEPREQGPGDGNRNRNTIHK